VAQKRAVEAQELFWGALIAPRRAIAAYGPFAGFTRVMMIMGVPSGFSAGVRSGLMMWWCTSVIGS
jgi:hypothetical protein